MEFVVSQRLGWKGDELESGRKPFERESDLKVLWNDWPYGLDGRIVSVSSRIVMRGFRIGER